MARWSPHERAMLLTVGIRLADARTAAGLSPLDVEQYGIRKDYIASAERGERNCTTLTLVRLGTIYGADPGDFISGLRHGRGMWPLEPIT